MLNSLLLYKCATQQQPQKSGTARPPKSIFINTLNNMKSTILSLSVLLLVASCTKQNGTPDIPINENVDTSSAMLRLSGSFMNGPFGAVSGTVAVYETEGAFTLALTDFISSNGPDLHVYLSKEEQPVHFIDLGKLKSVTGMQLYSIPIGTEIEQYPYALIHCQLYNHLFGSSLMQ